MLREQGSIAEWLGIFGSMIVAIVCVIVFAYSDFETKADFKESKLDFVQRLDRIENKVDQLLERMARK